jgi:hypothetical protein
MKSKINSGKYGFWLLAMVGLLSCQKNEVPENPFNNYTPNQDTVKFIYQDPDSFSIAGLYTYIFKPTCANVGCHDGTFEPDFRTLESAYNSLVFRESIKDDGGFPYRVQPYDVEKSGLMARVTGKMLPFMPIQLEPDSDWEQKKDIYISMIRRWIEAGAPDVDGRVPGNAQPAVRLLGAVAMLDDTTYLPRSPLGGPINIDSLTDTLRLYLAFGHDAQDPSTFSQHTIRFNDHPHQFGEMAKEFPLVKLGVPRLERGFYGEMVPYGYYVDLDLKMIFPESEKVFFRAVIKDQFHPLTEIPGEKALFNLKRYMSFERLD